MVIKIPKHYISKILFDVRSFAFRRSASLNLSVGFGVVLQLTTSKVTL